MPQDRVANIAAPGAQRAGLPGRNIIKPMPPASDCRIAEIGDRHLAIERLNLACTRTASVSGATVERTYSTRIDVKCCRSGR